MSEEKTCPKCFLKYRPHRVMVYDNFGPGDYHYEDSACPHCEEQKKNPTCQCEEFATLSSEYEKLAAVVSNISCILNTARQCNEWSKLNSKVASLEAENKKLKEFARGVIEDYCWTIANPPDGGSIQDFAEKLGLIEAHPATADDAVDFPDFEVGDPIYKFAEILKELKYDLSETVIR